FCFGKKNPLLSNTQTIQGESKMKKWSRSAVMVCLLSLMTMFPLIEARAQQDWGASIEQPLDAHSQQQFGITQPLDESAFGPYAGTNNALCDCSQRPESVRGFECHKSTGGSNCALAERSASDTSLHGYRDES